MRTKSLSSHPIGVMPSRTIPSCSKLHRMLKSAVVTNRLCLPPASVTRRHLHSSHHATQSPVPPKPKVAAGLASNHWHNECSSSRLTPATRRRHCKIDLEEPSVTCVRPARIGLLSASNFALRQM